MDVEFVYDYRSPYAYLAGTQLPTLGARIELGPKGVHVAYVLIDAVIDLGWTRAMHPNAADDFFIKPAEIAEEIWHVAHQPRGAWSSTSSYGPSRKCGKRQVRRRGRPDLTCVYLPSATPKAVPSPPGAWPQLENQLDDR